MLRLSCGVPVFLLLIAVEVAGDPVTPGTDGGDTHLWLPPQQETTLATWIRFCQELERADLLEDTGRGLRVLARLSKEQGQPLLLVDALLASAKLLGRTAAQQQVRHGATADLEGSSKQLRLLNALLEVARIWGRTPDDVELQRRAETALGGKTLQHGVTVAACREGYAQREGGRPLAALRVLLSAEAAMKRLPNTEGARAQLLNDQCNIQRGLGRLEAAKASCMEALRLDAMAVGGGEEDGGSAALFRFNLGQVLKDGKDYEGAIEQWLMAAHAQGGKDVDTWVSLGLAAERVGRPEEGLEYLRRGWEADPRHPFPYIAASSLLFRAGLIEPALPLLHAVQQNEAGGLGRHYHDRIVVAPPAHFTFPHPSVLSTWRPSLSPLPPLSRSSSTAVPPSSDPAPAPAPAPALPGVIAYLTSNAEKELQDLAVSLQLLQANLLSSHGPYPVIIFHDSLQPTDIQALRAAAPMPLSFQLVAIDAPPDSTPPSVRRRILPKYLGYGMGYRGMCRFFSGPIFTHPALAAFEWYMRLDTDSFFLAPLPFDPFRRLHEQNAAYGYLATGREEEKFAMGLWETFEASAAALGLRRPEMTEFVDAARAWDQSFFYTNFEVSRLDLWRSERYRRLMELLDQSGGFWLHRWGDGPVRVMAVSFFLNASQALRLPDVPYWHQTLVQRPPQRAVDG